MDLPLRPQDDNIFGDNLDESVNDGKKEHNLQMESKADIPKKTYNVDHRKPNNSGNFKNPQKSQGGAAKDYHNKNKNQKESKHYPKHNSNNHCKE